MQLEFRHGDTVVRVDGDVVEIFGQDFSHRYLLPSLGGGPAGGPARARWSVVS